MAHVAVVAGLPKCAGVGQLMEKKVVIIAGPNGAGKTTFAREFLPNEAHCPIFINADLIAAGISPFAPELAAVQAGRIMLKLIGEHVQRGDSFAIETTLSGVGYARAIKKWHTLGYHVKLIFLELPNPEFAIERVAERVKQGGHHIPSDVITRRFHSGLKNFHEVYKPLVDAWLHFDNSGEQAVLKDWSEQ